MKRHLFSQAGDTLIEVVFAIAILSTVLTAAYNLTTTGFKIGEDSREHVQAVSFAEKQMESVHWYATKQMAAGVSIFKTTPSPSWAAPLLEVCGYNVACSTDASANPVAAGPVSCGAAGPPGCLYEFMAIPDIALDTAVDNGQPPQVFPEIDEHLTLTWPSAVTGGDTCLNGSTGCETVTLSERIADTVGYNPIDCSVAGTAGCATGGGGTGTGGGLATMLICCNQSLSPGSQASFTVTQASPGAQVGVYDLSGNLVGTGTANASGSAAISTTYPSAGGDWTVHACYTSDFLICSANSATVHQLQPTLYGCAGLDPNFGVTYRCGLQGYYYNSDAFPPGLGQGGYVAHFDTQIWFPDFVPQLKQVLNSSDVGSAAVHWTGQIKLDPGVNTICATADDGAEMAIHGQTIFNWFGVAPGTGCGTYTNNLGYTWWFNTDVYYENSCCSFNGGGYDAGMMLSNGTVGGNYNLTGRLRSP